MNKLGQKVWGDVLSALKLSVSASSYRTWFSGSHVVDLETRGDRKILIVGLKNAFLKEQIEKRYLDTINEQLKSKLTDSEVVFVISQKEGVSSPESAPLLSGVAHTYFPRAAKVSSLATNHLFSNFVVGPTNNIAHMAAVQVANNLGQSYNPLVFFGPTGVGKTHLMQAIGNHVSNLYPDAKVMYVTSEKFTNDYLESLASRTQAAFRNKYRSVDLLLFDDIQFLAGKESTQDEFFHTFNDLVLSGKQVVAVSDRHPRELGKLKERLVSRFLGGMCADLGLPDYEMKVSIVNTKCREKGVELNEELVDFIARECKGGARELEGYLINALAQIKISGKYSLDDIKASASTIKTNVNISAGDIIKKTAIHYSVKASDIVGGSRRAKVVSARHKAIYLTRTLLKLPLVSIGDMFGGRDHSTVLYSIEKVRSQKNRDTAFSDDLLRLTKALSSYR